MSYLLDANVFIEASRRYYGFDLVPQFWDWLIDAHSRGVVMTVQQVADEITPGDELHNWFSQLPPTFVEPHTSAVATEVGVLSAWAIGHGFTQAAINTFMGSADLWLIAQARAHGHTVVSHEMLINLGRRNAVKIPNVCAANGVACIDTFDLWRRDAGTP